MNRHVKQLTANIVDTNEDAGGWTAVASSASVDRDLERIAPGAFRPLPLSVPVHDGHPLGRDVAPSVRQVGRAKPYYDGDTLYVDGTFSRSPQAQQLREMVLEGTIDSMSIMFHNAERKMVGDVPTIVSGELLAVDFVSVPSNRDARVLSVRGFTDTTTDSAGARAMVDRFITEAKLAMSELDAMDAVDALAQDPLEKVYRELGAMQDFLAELDRKEATRQARRLSAEAGALLSHLNGRH